MAQRSNWRKHKRTNEFVVELIAKDIETIPWAECAWNWIVPDPTTARELVEILTRVYTGVHGTHQPCRCFQTFHTVANLQRRRIRCCCWCGGYRRSWRCNWWWLCGYRIWHRTIIVTCKCYEYLSPKKPLRPRMQGILRWHHLPFVAKTMTPIKSPTDNAPSTATPAKRAFVRLKKQHSHMIFLPIEITRLPRRTYVSIISNSEALLKKL